MIKSDAFAILNTGFRKLCETNCNGSTAQTVDAKEACVIWKDGHDIQEYEGKIILKIERSSFWAISISASLPWN